MANVDLNQTKQSKQIKQLRTQLEKSAWKITREEERKFNGTPKWEIGDEVPNLIYSWFIQRNPSNDPIRLDFIAWWNFQTYETHINDCSECLVRNTEIRLPFSKDKSLQSDKNKEEWNQSLMVFMDLLSSFESQTTSI